MLNQINSSIKKLFAIKSNQQYIESGMTQNPENRQEGETYTQYGTRICAKVTGSIAALTPCLQRVYLTEKQRQIDDESIQQSRKDRLNMELEEANMKLSQNKITQDSISNNIAHIKDSITEQQQKLVEEKEKNGELNKMARIKMIIGIIILSILTIYLFIFYSSTFYSAFFKEFSFTTGVGEAMFDPQALPNAYSSGLGSLFFVICAPIIFMGLGFILHYYTQEKGNLKIPKIISIVAITFIFDCILAYEIAKKIYDIEAMTSLSDNIPPFGFGIAVTDINVWAVIFCGFITYMIWGFVFDLTMNAYEELRSNKREILIIEAKIANLKENVISNENELSEIKSRGVALQADIERLRYQIAQNVHYDINIIKAAMTDFFTGWITLMQPLGRPMNEQDEARSIFQNTLTTLFN